MMQTLPDAHSMTAIAAAAVVLLLPGTTSQAATSPVEDVEPVVQPRVELDRPLVTRGDRTPVYVLVRCHAAESPAAERANRPPLNLALVLDRSGSMEATGKIDYLKKAARRAVDGLNPRDHLAVVEYDTEITTLWRSQPVREKEPIKRLIDRLTPRGGTDLAAGMMRGVEEVAAGMQTIDAQTTVSRVLLLSDGLANHGVIHPAEIGGMVRQAKRQGVRISTLGLGLDYGEDLMQAIAQNGGGAFYHVEHPHEIARIYQEELATLTATVAKDARLRLEAAPGVVNATILGAHDPQQADLDLGSFHAGETHTLLAQFVPGETLFDAAGEVSLGEIAFSYHDLSNDRSASVRIPLTVMVVEDAQAALAARNPAVAIEIKLFAAERRHRDAVAQYQAGHYDAADQAMRELEHAMRKANGQHRDRRLATKFEALRVERDQMAAARTSADQRNVYLKRTKNRLYRAATGNRDQYLLQRGDEGINVERLQTALQDEGHYAGPVDGLYSAAVETSIKAFQADNSLTVDGIAGPVTMQKLGLY
ncbi:MAG: VWA domain-containing protein [Gammaproteobacteria bacterium]|nr:VWA domain-containing protein [Gammaproteobacteria bacterium]MYK48087.1 VWA domain-containing protein [Gammaproteobacteria bacterium]